MITFNAAQSLQGYPTARFVSAPVNTTNATATVLHTIQIPDKSVAVIHARIMAWSSASNLSSRFYRIGFFIRNGATVTQIGTTQTPSTDDESNASTNCNFLITGTTVQPRGIGLAATNFKWIARGRVYILPWA